METDSAERKHAYHHGGLRDALLAAGEAELGEAGIEGFSLRKVAKRAGVSHAAPAHHFGDANGLLTALAVEGFRKFLAAQDRREALAGDDPLDRLTASGLGYIDFAMAHPELFRLIFSSDRPDFDDPDLCAIAERAYQRLERHNSAVAAALGRAPDGADAVATWAVVHGLADLLGAGRLKTTRDLQGPERDAFLGAIIRRNAPR